MSCETFIRFTDELVALEASVNDLGVDHSARDRVFTGIGKTVNRIIDFILNMISALSKKITKIKDALVKKAKETNDLIFVYDNYDTIEYIQRANPLIRDYCITLNNLREVDQMLNKSNSVADSIKGSVVNSTVGNKVSETKRRYSEKIIQNFQNAESFNAGLMQILQLAESPNPHIKPKKYVLASIDKLLNGFLHERLAELESLRNDLEVTKQMYSTRSWMYKHVMHSEDIKRNQNILNHTQSLIQIVERFIQLYVKLTTNISSLPRSK